MPHRTPHPRRHTATDQNGKVTTYGYDDADRLTTVTDAQTPTAGVTTYAYDTENNLTDIYDAVQNHTQYSYYPEGWVEQITFPSGLTDLVQYDANGNMDERIHDRNGNYMILGYNPQNQMYLKQYGDGSVIYYYYDYAGRLYKVDDTNHTGTYTFTYDNMNRLTEADTQYNFVTGTPTFAVKYTYDAASNRKTMTDPQGNPTNYTPDTLNRLQTLVSPQGSFGFSCFRYVN